MIPMFPTRRPSSSVVELPRSARVSRQVDRERAARPAALSSYRAPDVPGFVASPFAAVGGSVPVTIYHPTSPAGPSAHAPAPRRKWTREELQRAGGRQQLVRTAVHEAGHAVVALLTGATNVQANIAPLHVRAGTGRARLGVTHLHVARTGTSASDAALQAAVILAGPLAARRYSGKPDPDDGNHVRQARSELLQAIGDTHEAERVLGEAGGRAAAAFDVPEVWDAVLNVALALVDHGSVSSEDLTELVGSVARRHRIE